MRARWRTAHADRRPLTAYSAMATAALVLTLAVLALVEADDFETRVLALSPLVVLLSGAAVAGEEGG